MNHFTLPVRELARKNFALLKVDARHPSLRFKKLQGKQLWSVRVGANHRAVAVEKAASIYWFWIGTHADYDQLLK